MIENEWGKGLGVKYQDEEGDWLKMRTDEDVVEVWSQTSSKNVSLKVFLREQNEVIFFFFFFFVILGGVEF